MADASMVTPGVQPGVDRAARKRLADIFGGVQAKLDTLFELRWHDPGSGLTVFRHLGSEMIIYIDTPDGLH